MSGRASASSGPLSQSFFQEVVGLRSSFAGIHSLVISCETACCRVGILVCSERLSGEILPPSSRCDPLEFVPLQR